MDQFTVKTLFGLTDKFVIPEYQRAYSWGVVQHKQLLEDLKDCSENYYMGHYLFEVRDEQDDTFYVIDGQQRMTTIVIFMSCMVRALGKRTDVPGNLKLSAIQRTYLFNNEDVQRFHTVRYDDALFNKEVIECIENTKVQYADIHTLPSSSQVNIRQCREYFEEQFKKASTEELLRWYHLIHQARITYYLVRSKEEAAQIFAFQNDRGKKLTNLEVLKSYFMLQLYLRGGKKQSDYIIRLEDAFLRMYKEIVHITTPEDAVLRYAWMGYGNKGFSTDKVLEEIKEHFRENDVAEILTFLDDLAQSFEYVSQFEHSSEKYKVYLKRLNNMGWSYPVLINACVHIGADSDTTDTLIRLMENITFRAMVRGGRASVEARLNRLINDVDSVDVLKSRMREFISDVTNSYWSDGQFENALQNGYIYHRRGACAYLLWRYEETLSGKGYQSTIFSIPKESIEHIAPQHPKEGEIANGYGVYVDFENPENGIESGEWLSSIGNLMLVSGQHNSSLGNRNFQDKVTDYGQANLLLQQKEINEKFRGIANPVWDVECIKERGDKIIAKAMEMWDVKKLCPPANG